MTFFKKAIIYSTNYWR